MKQILIFGAGRSSISMLTYLAEKRPVFNWNLKGIYIPTCPEIYEPIINELETYGIVFAEKLIDCTE